MLILKHPLIDLFFNGYIVMMGAWLQPPPPKTKKQTRKKERKKWITIMLAKKMTLWWVYWCKISLQQKKKEVTSLGALTKCLWCASSVTHLCVFDLPNTTIRLTFQTWLYSPPANKWRFQQENIKYNRLFFQVHTHCFHGNMSTSSLRNIRQ